MQPEKPASIGCCLGAVAHCPNYFFLLATAQFGGSSNLHAAIPSGSQAGPRSFTDHRPFEFGKAAKHLHDHAARSGCGIDGLGDASEAGADVPYSFHDVEEVF